jgi:ERCC4-type nuclease
MKPDFRPNIVIDSREQAPLTFTRLPSTTGTLQTGDYSVVGAEELFAVERKTVADLVGCCTGDNRERFERELHRLRGYRFKRLMVVGTRVEVEQHRYRSNVSPASVLGSIQAWEVRYDVPLVWAASPEDGAIMVERWAHYFSRELVKVADTLRAATSAPSALPAVLTLADETNSLAGTRDTAAGTLDDSGPH